VAEALILDAEALNALANRSQRGALADRARAILAIGFERGALVRVPAAVLAEVCRGPSFDAAIHHVLQARGILVEDLTADVARHAGALLARARLNSAHAVDAFVVATAARFSRAVIATGDVADINALAAPLRHVRVVGI
jgi:predicted nucleic acid-binding protein